MGLCGSLATGPRVPLHATGGAKFEGSRNPYDWAFLASKGRKNPLGGLSRPFFASVNPLVVTPSTSKKPQNINEFLTHDGISYGKPYGRERPWGTTMDTNMGEMQMTQHLFAGPQDITDTGKRIYESRYKAKYEQTASGKFVAIDVRSEKAFVADDAIGAIEAGRRAEPHGIFHLIKIGAPAAYRASYSANAARHRLAR